MVRVHMVSAPNTHKDYCHSWKLHIVALCGFFFSEPLVHPGLPKSSLYALGSARGVHPPV